jgi:Na+/proline symporter
LSAIDWAVLALTLAGFVAYGLWRGRGRQTLQGFLVADRSMPWYLVALSVMATQASAITFLSTPGQGYADGMRFLQFYVGLPLAMIVLCATAIPIYHRLRVFTAYEYLEGRFDGKTRTLTSSLFLVQRGLAAGLTIYAPSLIFSVLLGIPVHLVCVVMGGVVLIYTATGGSKAVSHTHFLQFLIIIGTIALAFVLIVAKLPAGITPFDAAHVAGSLGRLNALDLSFDLQNRYNLWSGLIGGFFLQLSYFGADQSQVGRYLTGQSVTQSRLGLLFNGLVKVPMQFAILALGVLVFVFFQFVAPPAFFNPVESEKARNGVHGEAFRAAEARHQEAFREREASVRAFVAARRAGDEAALRSTEQAMREAQDRMVAVRGETVELIQATDPAANLNDTNYVFLNLVLHHLPIGIVGLALAAIFAASMNSVSAEMNALATTTVVDVVRRLRPGASAKADLWAARIATIGWAAFAVGFAEYASRLGSLIEAVNILGSLFYGTILGVFLTAFYLKRVGGNAVFVAALIAEAAVVACFFLSKLSFLWFNVVGCLVVIVAAVILSAMGLDRRRDEGASPGRPLA